ncbi:MAG TPA: hypothetical protein VF796_05805, partial [Humisphaera sp.]
MTKRLLACAALALSLLAAPSRGADAPPAAPPAGKWVNVSDPLVDKITADGKKLGYPGGTAGVICDAATGDLYVIVAGQGAWKSSDKGATFARADGGAVGGRCETAFAINADPAGRRFAFFMLDGKCAITTDAGKTWQPMKDLGRNWDYAAVDWSGEKVANIFGARHEVGGEAYLSTDGGASWKLLYKDAAFDKTGGVGIFDANTLVRTWAGKGVERSTDGGQTWAKASDLQPVGRVCRVYKGTAYWLGADGVLTSKDKGATWAKVGDACPGTIGPMFDPKDDNHLAVAGAKGIFESADGGKTWRAVAPLPEKFDVPRPGVFTNV